MNKKKLFIILGIIFAILVFLLIVFAIKCNKEKKFVENENNYTIKFKAYSGKRLTQMMTFIYRDKKLSDISVTLYYKTEGTAKGVYKEYESLGEFKSYKVDGTKVIMYYKDSDVIDYKGYSKEELIQEFTSAGYKYVEKK